MKGKLYTLIIICATVLITASCGADHFMKRARNILPLVNIMTPLPNLRRHITRHRPRIKTREANVPSNLPDATTA